MTKYLLTCGCGKTVPVEVGQAGGSAACSSCGARLDVPPLRKLRHLPVVSREVAESRAAWNARKGIVVASLVSAGLLAAVSLWSRLAEPTVPQFDRAAYQQLVDQGLQGMTPAEGWQRWTDVYRPLAERGFFVFEHRDAAAIEQQIAKRRFLQKMMLILAAVCAAIAVAAALWPRSAARG